MCYTSSQLAFRIYKDAKRLGASEEELAKLYNRWKEIEKLDSSEHNNYAVSGFNHPKLIVFTMKSGKIDIDSYTWGLIPSWVKDEVQAQEIWNKTLNARGETIFDKSSFKEAAQTNRCVIPLDGFFEHHYKGGNAFPYFIRAKNKKRLLVGGLTSEWLNRETGELIKTTTIVTTKGNEIMAKIHNNPKLMEARMPLVLNENDARLWLIGKEAEVKDLIKPNAKIQLESYSVRKLSGKHSVGNVEQAQEEFIYDELNESPKLF